MSVDDVNDGPDQASPDKGEYTYIDPDGTTEGFADGYLDTNSNEQTFTNPAFNNYDNRINDGGYACIDPAGTDQGTNKGFADGYLDTNANEQTFTNPAFNNYDDNIAQEPQDFDQVLNREVPVWACVGWFVACNPACCSNHVE